MKIKLFIQGRDSDKFRLMLMQHCHDVSYTGQGRDRNIYFEYIISSDPSSIFKMFFLMGSLKINFSYVELMETDKS